jgi:hypothetical protein
MYLQSSLFDNLQPNLAGNLVDAQLDNPAEPRHVNRLNSHSNDRLDSPVEFHLINHLRNQSRDQRVNQRPNQLINLSTNLHHLHRCSQMSAHLINQL